MNLLHIDPGTQRELLRYAGKDGASDKWKELAERFGLDARVIGSRLLHPSYVCYYMALRQILNPKNEEGKIGIYAGAGADISCFLLATNASRGVFIDQKIDSDHLRQMVEDLPAWNNLEGNADMRQYAEDKYRLGFSRSTPSSGLSCKEKAILFELKGLGVERESIRVISNRSDGVERIRFFWNYPRTKKKLKREIIYSGRDITRPGSYPAALTGLAGRLDFYFQKAALTVPFHYKEFLPVIVLYLRDKGFLITNDCGASFVRGKWKYGLASPEACLRSIEKNSVFKEIALPSLDFFEKFIARVRDPDRSDSRDPVRKRYGWQMIIRKKLESRRCAAKAIKQRIARREES